jgi:hypothetical protein
MSEQVEKQFYDPRFKPNLYEREFLKPIHKDWFSRWDMDVTGVPVVMPGDQKAAVWRGSFNSRNEAPVLAVVIDRKADLYASISSWYAGALALQDLVHVESENIAVLDAAAHGPLVLHEALELLVNFVPPSLYPA